MLVRTSTKGDSLDLIVMRVISINEGPNVDTATARTIGLMSTFALNASPDPEVRRAASAAWSRFGRGASDVCARAAGVFWWLKHCMKFRRDEVSLFRLGLGSAFDFVIDPRILVRMAEPAEDCDGFSTMGAALCRCLGVPYYFATAATEFSDPRRWSHVWLVVDCGGRLVDLDGSHGKYFGWGVPQNRRYRFALWDARGRRVQ